MSCEEWIHQVEDLTELRVGVGLSRGTGTVLLAPIELELDPTEEEELFEVIRNALLGPTGKKSAVAIRNRIDRLDGSDLLPLLYATRLISTRYGGTNRFWPPFRKHLLANSLTHNHDFQNHIPEALTRAWFRLHQATSGALYMPTEGPRHIRWPVAHAGLVHTDTNNPDDPLILYGCELKSEAPDGLHDILLDEPQNFLQDLRGWITDDPRTAETHLARRLLDKKVAVIVAELAQRKLRQLYFDLPCDIGPSQRSIVIDRPSVRVVFDSTRQRLLMRVEPGTYRGRTEGWLNPNGDRKVLVGYFDALYKRQGFREETFLLSDTSWPEKVDLEFPDLDLSFSRKPPDNPFSGDPFGILICDADTGRQTRRWQPDSAYTVVSTLQRAEDLQIAGCLSIALSAGEPIDGFPDLMAFISSSVTFAEEAQWDEEANSINTYLEDINAEFRIPSRAEAFSPQIKPVGLLSRTRTGVPRFPGSTFLFRLEPADIGWPEVRLQKWRPDDVSFQTIASAEPIAEDGIQYIGFDSHEVEDGRFRLEGNSAQLEFIIESTNEPTFLGSAQLSLSATQQQETNDVEIIRSSENEATVFVAGLPEAILKLSVQTGSQLIRRRIDLDRDGEANFGTGPLHLPDGIAQMQATFQGRKSNVLNLVNGPFILPGTWKIGLDPPHFDAYIEGLEDDITLEVHVIGSRPWMGELAAHSQRTRFGRLEIPLLRFFDWEPSWLVVTAESMPPLLIEEWPVPAERLFLTADDFGPTVDQSWRKLRTRLEKTSLPPQLAQVIQASIVAEFAADHPAIREPEVLRPVDSIEAMVSMADMNVAMTAVLGDSTDFSSVRGRRMASLQRSGEDWVLAFDSQRAELSVDAAMEGGIFNFRPIGPTSLAACGTCDALMPSPRAAVDHVGSGPDATCGSIDLSVAEPTGNVLYKGSASDLIYEVGALLVEGLAGTAGPPPASLQRLVTGIRESFREQGIPQTGRERALLEGLRLAIDVVEMFEQGTRPIDIDRLAQAVSRTSAPGQIARAVLMQTSILGGDTS